MSKSSIILASSDADYDEVRDLCRDFVKYLLDAHPEYEAHTRAYFHPRKYEETLLALPVIHARPKGAILLAKVDDASIGCVMYHELRVGTAEMKRLYVSKHGRGKGVATDLVLESLRMAHADGYGDMRLDSARFLTPAIELYRKLGFKETDPTTDVPVGAREVAIFMHKEL